MPELIHRRTTVSNIAYHIVWSTKQRKRVIVPELAGDLKVWADETAVKYGFTIHQMQTGNRDHVHLFISAPPDMPVSDVVKLLKGTLSFKAFRKYAFLSRAYPKHHL